MCLIYFTVISLPSIPCCSVSSGLNVAPAHTSARHEAVRVWLESMSGGSTDLKGITKSRLRLLSVYRLAFSWSMQKHANACWKAVTLKSSALLGSDQHLLFHFSLPQPLIQPSSLPEYVFSLYSHSILHWNVMYSKNRCQHLKTLNTTVFLALMCEVFHLLFQLFQVLYYLFKKFNEWNESPTHIFDFVRSTRVRG